jgi:amidophosphoribosyltransferase
MEQAQGEHQEAKPREACGVFGVYGAHLDVARLTYFGLHALQHRGQESAGIVSSDGQHLHVHRKMGLVTQVFSEEVLQDLDGVLAIGHTRYSTTGSSSASNAQPFLVDGPLGELAVAHNGNLINTEQLHDMVREQGIQPQSSTDSELAAWLIALAPGATWREKITRTLPLFIGSYSLVMATARHVYAVRDPLGNRPLCLGRLDGGWVVASESCALATIGAEIIREIDPGELVQIGADGITTYPVRQVTHLALCMFEFLYLARVDSYLHGKLLYTVRRELGHQLARERPAPVGADMVIGVPDTALVAAQGFAEESGIPLREGLVRNRYVHRTFIQPTDGQRKQGVHMKFNPMPEVLQDKKVVVVDDTIVRGTSTRHIVKVLRQAGAKEVHVRIAAPPIRYPCYLGVDMPTRGELIASPFSSREEAEEVVSRFLEADSVGYLSIEGIVKATGLDKSVFCLACFNGEYPVPVQMELDKFALERPKVTSHVQ